MSLTVGARCKSPNADRAPLFLRLPPFKRHCEFGPIGDNRCMVRVLLHTGFHKTGTTSLQTLLTQNRDALAPYVQISRLDSLDSPGIAARLFGQRPTPKRLRAYRAALQEAVNDLPDAPVVILSRENLSGPMPGYRRWGLWRITRYDLAPVLLKPIIRALRRRYGPDVQIELVLTTRRHPEWVASVLGHLARSGQKTGPRLARRLNAAPDLPAQADWIARKTGLTVPHLIALEKWGQHPLGPGAALLELAGVPANVQTGLRPPGIQNARPRHTPRR